tara:strand:+ start:47 stop:619 length:573 start_codon:yes stop_codon:yes gene_type:complete
MYILCGLGNPGKKYEHTRHNVGFKFIDTVLKKHKYEVVKKDKEKEIYKIIIKKKEFYIFKPLTYMNLSGQPLGSFLNYYKIVKKNLTVIHDDIDIEVGKFKIKYGGGNAGHNGLQSIDETIGNLYNRFRVGVGHPGNKEMVNHYVLEKFNPNEQKLISKLIDLSIDNLYLLIDQKNLFLNKVKLKFNESS